MSDFEIAVICTGNRFRSPIVEALLRLHAEKLPLEVRSLGIRELGAVPVLPEAVTEADRIGLDLSAHRARALAGQNLADVDLVLGFEHLHIASAVVDGKAQAERTFLLTELVELLRDLGPPQRGGPEGAREQVERAHRLRTDEGGPRAEIEIADPLGGSSSTYRHTAERLEALCSELADQLFGHHHEEPHEDGLLERLRRRGHDSNDS